MEVVERATPRISIIPPVLWNIVLNKGTKEVINENSLGLNPSITELILYKHSTFTLLCVNVIILELSKEANKLKILPRQSNPYPKHMQDYKHEIEYLYVEQSTEIFLTLEN